ncbi:metalloproteinase [Culex quinquefasciatus]|uniref:Metalloendopeptidase n=1 Tax=Culex quinquefasciatus TaxID=7176 RepID=B0WSG6_CULQU|nr:metalloproteinase [Culex quinquefasciatus]|eukprot:XP_001852017.1 metalloproteinase [Culex quinquefasciatus]
MNCLNSLLVALSAVIVGSWARHYDFRVPINGTRGAPHFATQPSCEVGKRHRNYSRGLKPRCHPFEMGIGIYYQMDIMLKPDVVVVPEEPEIIEYNKYRWPGGRVPYVIKGNFSAAHKTIIALAMAQYAKSTCVRFVPRTNEVTFVTIDNTPTGCWSYVGRSLNNKFNFVNLQVPGCVSTGTVAHELMHILGFYHEFTRMDRDNFITIDMGALDPAYQTASFFNGNYGKLTSNLTPLYGIPYSYGSVMHYSKWAGSTSRSRPVMNNIKPWTGDFGNKIGLAASDVQAINIIPRTDQAIRQAGLLENYLFPNSVELILESFYLDHWGVQLFTELNRTRYLSLLYGSIPAVTFESPILETFSVVQTNTSSFEVSPVRNSVLKTLQITRNKLATISPSIRQLSGLTTLDLSQNELEYVDLDLFAGMKSLKNLDLSVNQISSVDASPALQLGRLRNLWVSYNRLQRFESFPEAFPALDTVRLIGNRWSCGWVDGARRDIMDRRITAFGVDYGCSESRQGGLCCYNTEVTTTEGGELLREGPLLEEIQKLTSELGVKPLDTSGDQSLELLTRSSGNGQEKILVGVKHHQVKVFF